jgi:HK97 family phage prohead protease
MKTTVNKYKGRMGMQHKLFSINSKDVQYDPESRIISGYAAIFGNKDKAGDILLRGCFSKSIRERGPESGANDKIIFLWMHDMSEPIGLPTILREDEKGLYFEARIDEIELGDRAITQLESGTLNQFSIGYEYVWENCEWDYEKEALIVREVKLYEISVVSIGCNGETEYLGLKSIEDCEKEYKELDEEVSLLCKNMSLSKQCKLQKIIAKAMSLASFRPENATNTPPLGTGADNEKGGDKKELYKMLKLKSV